MKILHVITSLLTGGAERLMVDLLPLLCDNGNNQVDLLLFNGKDTLFSKEIKKRDVKVLSLSKTNDVYHPRNLFRLRKHLNHYNIIHTHNTAPQLYVPLAKMLSHSKAKLVTTEHNSTNRRRLKWWYKPIDRWMYSKYTAIICIADQTRLNLEQYIGKSDKISTIYNGVDVNRLIHPIKDISRQKDFTIIMVSSFREQKDHETLFRSMTHLPDNYRLQVVGGGTIEEKERLHSYCSQLRLNDQVEFMGVRTDVPDLLESSDVVVLSSHWEGLSLSSIEGMASGRPFIASDVDGLHELVGGAGVLFPHGDDKALAESIQFLCEHPDEYREVAKRCQDKAKQYDITVMAKNYLDLYKRLLGQDC